jgi:4-oxalocrotonate tautomerase
MSMAAKAPVTDRSTKHDNQAHPMPIVTIKITREGTAPGAVSVTPGQKAALIRGAGQLLLDVLNKPLESTVVVIDEVELENWGSGGLPVREYRKKLASEREASTS